MRVGIALVVAVLVGALLATLVQAHGGGLDSNGGHNDRKSGGYHFHRGPLAGQRFSSKSAALLALQAHQQPTPAKRSTPAPSYLTASPARPPTDAERLDALVRLLVRKGFITEEELSREVAARR